MPAIPGAIMGRVNGLLASPGRTLVSRLEIGTNVAGVGFLIYGIVTTGDISAHGGFGVAVPLIGVCIIAWAGWLLARAVHGAQTLLVVALGTIACAGGALVGVAPLAMVFTAVAAMGACTALPLRQAAAVAVGGLVGAAVSTPLAGRPWTIWLGALSAVLAGTIVGVNRRIAQERAAGVAAVEVARARADAESARAELLAGRNHMARELHDVLAHTLSALSLQLEALDAQTGDRDPALATKIAEIKGLVREGLREARGAVAALREELPPLEERLAALAAQRGAALEITGRPRPLPGNVSLALYRVAQEALTNVAKHAKGSSASVQVVFDPGSVTVCVTNTVPPSGAGGRQEAWLGENGRRYGLQGIRERVLLLGGTVEAGPLPGGGWRVLANAPAGPATSLRATLRGAP